MKTLENICSAFYYLNVKVKIKLSILLVQNLKGTTIFSLMNFSKNVSLSCPVQPVFVFAMRTLRSSLLSFAL